jgi:hypothetical protein
MPLDEVSGFGVTEPSFQIVDILFAGLTILGFDGYQPALLVDRGATVTLLECSFMKNDEALSNSSSSVYFDADKLPPQTDDTIVRLERCTFDFSNLGSISLTRFMQTGAVPTYTALFYSDAPVEVTLDTAEPYSYTYNITVFFTMDLSNAPAARQGIDRNSTWFQTAQQVCYSCSLRCIVDMGKKF